MRPGAPSLIGKSIKIALDAIAGGGGVARGRGRAGGVGAEGRAGEGGLVETDGGVGIFGLGVGGEGGAAEGAKE